MGLKLNHISASFGSANHRLLDGQSRAAIGVSGSMYFEPHGAGAARGAASLPVHGLSQHPDAAYIFSGTVGGNDKSLFLGDVVVSGSLALGDGSSFIDGEIGATEVAFGLNDNTLEGEGSLTYTKASRLLKIGASSGDAGSLNFANNDAMIFRSSAHADFGIMSSMKIAVTGTRTPGAGLIGMELGSDAGVVLGQGGGGAGGSQNGFIRVRALAANANVGNNVEGAGTEPGSAAVMVKADAGGLLLSGALDTKVFGKTGLILGSQDEVDVDAVAAVTVDAGDAISLDAAAASNFTTSAGALTLDGAAGVNIAGNSSEIDISSAGAVDINSTGGAVTIDAGAASNFTTTAGALTLKGGAGETIGTANLTSAFLGDVTVAQDLVVAGNVEVNGLMTSVDTTNLEVKDRLIGLNYTSGSGAAALNDSGFVVGNSGGNQKAFYWDNSEDHFAFVDTTSTTTSTTVSPDSYSDIRAGHISGSAVSVSGLTLNRVVLAGPQGALKDDGDLTFDGSTLVANSALTVGASSPGAVAIDGTTLSLDGTAASNLSLTANSNSAVALTIASANSGAGTGTIDMDADGIITVDAGAGLSLQGGAASDLTTGAGALTLDGNGGVNIVGNAAEVDITTSGNVDINGAAITIDGSAVDITSTEAGPTAIVLHASNASGGIDLSVNSAVVLSLDANSIDISQSLLPTADNSIDLGGSGNRFANIYTGDLNLRNDRGDWTLIEEEDFISFRNNKTGRRFRMVMEDITGLGIYGPGNDGEM